MKLKFWITPGANVATVCLTRSELQSGELPMVCVCCGSATGERSHARLMSFRGSALLPVCQRHTNYWFWRAACSPITAFLVSIVVFTSTTIGVFDFEGAIKHLSDRLGISPNVFWIMWICNTYFVFFFLFVQSRRWFPFEIGLSQTDKQTITLTGVAPEFVAALGERRLSRGLPLLQIPETPRELAPSMSEVTGATIQLTRSELQSGQLPLVCVCCGGATGQRRSARIVSARGSALLPVCRRHANYWYRRAACSPIWAALLSAAVFIVMAKNADIFDSVIGPLSAQGLIFHMVFFVARFCITGCFFAFLVFLFERSFPFVINLAQANRQSIALTGVAPEFVAALREQRLSRGLPPLQLPENPPYPPEVCQILHRAAAVACQLHHDWVGTEHLLVALGSEPNEAIATVFRQCNLDSAQIQQRIVNSQSPFAESAVTIRLALTPMLKKALVQAAVEAQNVNQSAVSPEHVLLGLLHEQDSAAAQMLAAEGFDLSTAREVLCKTSDCNKSAPAAPRSTSST